MSAPKVISKETDLTYRVQSFGTLWGAMIGTFQWGAVEEIVDITGGEEQLKTLFGAPNDETAISYLSAKNFLLYSGALKVARAVGTLAKNAVPSLETPLLIKNIDHYESVSTTGLSFIGRCAGALGNSLKVSVVDQSGFDTWAYKDQFNYAPVDDEIHLVIIDKDGLITGVAGSILEKHELLSTTVNTKKSDGTSAYYKTVINKASQWLFVGDTSELVFTSGLYETEFEGGVSDDELSTASIAECNTLFSNKSKTKILTYFGAGLPSASAGLIIDSALSRKDCYGIVSPNLASVRNTLTPKQDVIDYRNTQVNKNTSYGIMCDNWKLVFDDHNNVERWIPCDSDVAGIITRSWQQNEPHDSPAGYNRGQLLNVIKLAWTVEEGSQDHADLYNAQVNSIISTEGEGTFLMGDKTMLTRPSAFDRINVRSIAIVIRESISRSAKYQLFENNTVTTRSLFTNATDSYLRTLQAKGGLYDRRVICDETNNTPDVIDSNKMAASVFYKPVKSINYIEINFVATATGVDFTEFERKV